MRCGGYCETIDSDRAFADESLCLRARLIAEAVADD